MKQRFTITSYHDTKHDGQESTVNLGGFLFAGDDEGEDGGEEWGGGAYRLVERDGEVTERGVTADDGEAEDDGEGEDLQELTAGDDVLQGGEVEVVDGEEGVGGAGEHVEEGEEDGVAVAVNGEEVLVEEEDSNVG